MVFNLPDDVALVRYFFNNVTGHVGVLTFQKIQNIFYFVGRWVENDRISEYGRSRKFLVESVVWQNYLKKYHCAQY